MDTYSGTGALRVQVTEVGGTLPIKNAIVRILEYGDEGTEGSNVLYSLRTDSNGLTPTVYLPAPPAGDSMKPGDSRPYSIYNVTVDYGGYYPVEGVGIPIFDGITSTQPVNLQPLSEEARIAGAENGGRVVINETGANRSLLSDSTIREDIGNENGTVSGSDISESDTGTRPISYTDGGNSQNSRPYNVGGAETDQNSGAVNNGGIRGYSSPGAVGPDCYGRDRTTNMNGGGV